MSPHPDHAAPTPRPSDRFFGPIVDHPRKILALVLVVFFAAASQLPAIYKDTRSDAFIPPGHASLEMRDRVEEVFGLADPIVVAVEARPGADVFTPETLALVDWLTTELEALEGIDGARVTSLATESDIRGTEDGMYVEPFFEEPPATLEAARRVGEAVLDFPLYVGSIVAADGRATVIVAELDDAFDAGDTYAAVTELTGRAPVQGGETLHVAGEGGVTAHLGRYIDADARRMVPLALVAITIMLGFAYRTARSVLLPNLIIIGAVVVALGSMAAAGVPWYLITTAMPVILVAIGVADGIHIFGHYYRALATRPGASQRELVLESMAEMWQPVVVTSLTDVAGFIALALSTTMPPLRAFGLYASVGVLAAFALSLVALPAALVLMKRRPSPAIRCTARSSGSTLAGDALAKALARLGEAVARRPAIVLAIAVGIVGLGLVGAAQVRIDYERIRNFRPEEPIRIADEAINRHLDGTSYLDVMIETERPQGLFDPELLAAVEAFQRHLAELPHVGGTTSIADYLRQMNRSLNEDRAEAYRLPETRDAVAQTLLVFEMEGDTSQIEKSIDYPYQRANLRVSMTSSRFSHERHVVQEAERYIARHLDLPGVEVSLAGRVNVDVNWMQGVADAHFRSVAIALLAVFAMSALLFRSVAAGLLTVLPVCTAVLMIYAVMSALDLWLGITTSMFAAIAIGLGVDFAVHAISRLRMLTVDEGHSIEEAVEALFPSTGRELLFNFACAGLGFGVLASSHVPTLVEFGLLTAVAVGGAFVATVTLIPALACLARPRFLAAARSDAGRPGHHDEVALPARVTG